jgi:hypothetical protein
MQSLQELDLGQRITRRAAKQGRNVGAAGGLDNQRAKTTPCRRRANRRRDSRPPDAALSGDDQEMLVNQPDPV